MPHHNAKNALDNYATLCTWVLAANSTLAIMNLLSPSSQAPCPRRLCSLSVLLSGLALYLCFAWKVLGTAKYCVLSLELTHTALAYLSLTEGRRCLTMYMSSSMTLFYLIEQAVVSKRLSRLLLTFKQLAVWQGVGYFNGDLILTDNEVLVCATTFLLCIYSAWTFTAQRHIAESFTLKLAEVRTQLASIIQVVPEVIILISSQREVKLINDQAKTALGVTTPVGALATLSSLAYVEGSRNYAGSTTNDRLMVDILHFVSQSRPSSSVSFGHTTLLGRVINWKGIYSVSKGEASVLLSGTDITDVIELQRQKADNFIKNLVYRTVSHEVKTPVNTIMHSSVQVRALFETGSREHLKLSLAEVCCKQILHIVHSLADFSLLLSNSLHLEKVTFRPRDVLMECVLFFELLAAEKEVQLVVKMDPLLPELAYNDPVRFRQVVLSLLSHALKFTAVGRRVELFTHLKDNGDMKVKVTDSGIGMSPDLITLIHSNIHAASADPLNTNFSLQLSSQLAMLLGGCGLKVKSELDKGSSISLYLHLTEGRPSFRLVRLDSGAAYRITDETAPRSPLKSRDLHNHRRPPSILIVDDYPFNRMVLSEILAAEGMDSYEVDNGQEAVRYVVSRLATNPVKLIIMDFEMPLMSGPMATIAILSKCMELGKEPPVVVAHTCYNSPRDISACIEAGMVDFIPKPCSRDELLRKVRMYLRS
jgi:CheY-like chemotaxis protein